MTNKIELQVLERDNYTCRKCGNQSKYLSVEPIEINWELSDISYYELGLSENYLTLCADCCFLESLFYDLDGHLHSVYPDHYLSDKAKKSIRFYLNNIGIDEVYDSFKIAIERINNTKSPDDLIRYFFGVCAKKIKNNLTKKK